MARFPSPSARVLITAGALAVGVLVAEWIVAPWALRRERTVAGELARIIVLFFPVERDLHLAPRARGLPWDGFRHTLQGRGIEVLDLEQALAAAAEREPIYATTHLNAAGNSAVAAHVLEWIEHANDGWAPPAGRDRWPR